MTDKPENKPSNASDRNSVGYGRPPRQRRFKGSGNPNGRPNGAKNRETIVRTVANEVHTIIEGGKRARRSTLELVLIRLRNMALEGKNLLAFDELHKLFEMHDPRRVGPEAGYVIVPAPMSVEDWIAQAEHKNALMEKHGVRNLAEAIELERQLRKTQKLEQGALLADGREQSKKGYEDER